MSRVYGYEINHDPDKTTLEERRLIRDGARSLGLSILHNGKMDVFYAMLNAFIKNEDFERAEGFKRAQNIFNKLTL